MRTDSRELLAVGILGRNSRVGDRIELLLRRGRIFSPHVSNRHLFVSATALSGLMLVSSLAPRWIAFAQAVTPKPQTFEVISIKPNSSGLDDNSMRTSPGHLTALNTTPYELLRWAFAVKEFQLAGVPNWFHRDKFDFDAVTGTSIDLNRTTLQPFLQSMFVDRFHLRFHRESREAPMYSLVVVKGGPRLTVHSGGGEPITGIHSSSGKERVNAGKSP